VAAGEALLASVYGALRNSSFWNETLLVVTYDEHGEGERGAEGVRCLWGT
jgi:phospholipase C